MYVYMYICIHTQYIEHCEPCPPPRAAVGAPAIPAHEAPRQAAACHASVCEGAEHRFVLLYI